MRLIGSLCIFLLAAAAFGQTVTHTVTNTAGTTTMTSVQPKGCKIAVYTISSTSDASGNVTATLPNIQGKLTRVVTNPGATAPTDDWDVVLNDADGLDVFMGKGANRDTANSEQFTPFTTDGTNVSAGVAVGGTHTLSATNAGNAKVFVIRLYVERG